MSTAKWTFEPQADILFMPWPAYDGTTITLRQGQSRRNGRAGPLLTIPLHSRAPAYAGRHGAGVSTDSDHKNGPGVQEAVFR